MKEHPIPFNDEMVRALLSGQKTQTRRVVNHIAKLGPVTEFQRSDTPGYDWSMRDSRMRWHDLRHSELLERCPHGQPGDRLWVQEAWARYNIDQDSHDMAYRATTPSDWPAGGRWRQSNHMPRWASRITREITGVRVERLQDISDQDAWDEGVDVSEALAIPASEGAIAVFSQLWESIYGPDSWDANPWVWVIEFRLIQQETA